MRLLGRILRRVATGLSVLLLVGTLAAWGRGCRSLDTLRLERESLDEGGWQRRWWVLSWGGGDVGVDYWSDRADAPRARAAGCVPGVRWAFARYANSPARVSRMAADWVRDLGKRRDDGGVWEHGGVVLARAGYRAPDAGPAGAHLAAYERVWFIALPCWMAAVAFSVLPAQRTWALVRRRRRRRAFARRGLCTNCGYDLRATPEAGSEGGALLERCPECGRAAPASTPAPAGPASRRAPPAE